MTNEWTQDISELYRKLSQIAVPARTEQIATLLTLIPFAADEAFRVVELASGEGYLAQAIAAAFPQAQILALDYEESMRDATAKRLDSYSNRTQVAAFDILQDDWFAELDGVDVVVSSLCVHHLDGVGKQRLFKAVAERSSANGTLLLADIIDANSPQAHTLFAATWDSMAEAASIEKTLSRDLFQAFEAEHWNLFHYPDPDFDKPSPLFAQLQWLQAAGFTVVDCFWMQAGHAIYGGYGQTRAHGLKFEDAYEIARKILAD
jgi:tRNA (cmo5U34)-methyltransferase